MASESPRGPAAPVTLHVVPQRWFAGDFTILDGERTVAEIRHSWWRDAGELVVSGSPYEVRREKFLARTFIAKKSGARIARAERTNRFRHEYVIEHDVIVAVLLLSATVVWAHGTELLVCHVQAAQLPGTSLVDVWY
jgi:hypothetical protein